MSKTKRKLQAARRRNLFIYRRDDGKFDIVDQCGPCDLALTKHQAVNMVYQASTKPDCLKVHIQEANGMWHRGNCEKVAYDKSTAKSCKCHYLALNNQ